jgi:alanine racemase
MDVTTVDLSDATGVRPGDEVTLLGREGEVALDAQQIAETAGTISYSVLCNISPRVERVYV